MIDLPGRRRALAALARLAGLAGLTAGAVLPVRLQAEGAAVPSAFDFIALGDMPYGPDLLAGPPYRSLIDRINGLGLPFAIHVGDFKDGTAACGDDEYERQWRHFQRFAGPVIFTPGDNDWLDCHRRGNDPLERLQALRERFFPSPMSLGRQPIALQRQADRMPAHAAYVENQRWLHRGVVFATVHTVGHRNAFDADAPAVRAEAARREAANAAWIGDSFALARQTGASAMVLATQAETLQKPKARAQDPDRGRVSADFPSIRDTLLPLADAAPHPVLLVHGDFHTYRFDQPFALPDGKPVANLWRLQVFGHPRLHAVRVRVQAGVAGQPFVCSPVWNPLSSDPRQETQPVN